MLLIRTIFVPFMQRYQVGPMLFLIELFYFNISFVKGLTRIVLLVIFTLDSFFTPAMCAFPEGKEAWDGGHLTFVCYAMSRVEADKQLQAEWGRRMRFLGINEVGKRPDLASAASSSMTS